MKLPVLLTTLAAAVAVPGAAVAAPVKIGPRAPALSQAGVATVEVANPNRYALRGSAKVAVGGRTVSTSSVRLAKRSVTRVALRFGAKSVARLRAAQGRATVNLQLRRANGRKAAARRTLRLRLPAGGPQQPTPPTPDPGAGGPNGGQPAPPASNRWVGRMGTEGPYDDLELTLDGDQMQITRTPPVPVACFENGGSYRSALSFELFGAPGPWTIGTDGSVAKSSIAVNQLVGGGARSITYKVTDTTQQAGRIAGTLGMSFFDSKYDIFTNTITFINCAGSQSFEAVPAT